MIVRLLESIIGDYSDEEKCGFCWNFHHGRKDYTNLAIDVSDDLGCVNFLLEKYSKDEVYTSDEIRRDHEIRYTDYQFEAFAGFRSSLAKQYHTEDDSVENSKWVNYIEPIEICLDSLKDEICGLGLHSVRFKTEPFVNYKDANLDGVKIYGTFRKYP